MDKEIINLAVELDKHYPNNRDAIADWAELANDAVNEGGLLEHELSLMRESIEAELTKED